MAKNLIELPEDLKKIFEKVVDKHFLRSVAEEILAIMYKRIKSGQGLKKINPAIGGTDNAKLAKLRPATVRKRAQSVLGPLATPSRSNLTMSGELLESIKVRQNGRECFIEIPDLKHGSNSKLNMQDLAKYLEEGDPKRNRKPRPFFGLSDTDKKIIENMIRELIRYNVRQLSKK